MSRPDLSPEVYKTVTVREPTADQRKWYSIYVNRHGVTYGSATPEYVMYNTFGVKHWETCQACREDWELNIMVEKVKQDISLLSLLETHIAEGLYDQALKSYTVKSSLKHFLAGLQAHARGE